MQEIGVSEVAAFLKVSERRVRLLLSQGRISGHKDAFNIWRVYYPLDVRPGKRGPDLRGYPSRLLKKKSGSKVRPEFVFDTPTRFYQDPDPHCSE